MKKILSILLIVIYSTATFGMSVKELYCCGKLTSVSVSFNTVNKEKQSKDDGCCKTKYHSYKINDNHIIAKGIAFATAHFFHPQTTLISFDNISFINTQIDKPVGIHDPPLINGNLPIYIFNCVFRI